MTTPSQTDCGQDSTAGTNETLILPGQRVRMLENFKDQDSDHAPVVKWLCPWNGALWLLTTMDPDNEDLLYGLCDLGGNGDFDLGTISRAEAEAITGVGGQKIMPLPYFRPLATLSVYAEAATQVESTIFGIGDLLAAYQRLAEEARKSGSPLKARLLDESGETMSFPLAMGLQAIR
ncbi:DUF2958 domain-containing protein [Pelagibius sp. Alg239-R121]|uniref:DUF2958 domain-containing protein n=1 Tax=Pelagibius sp. Alg239-R121 TaxID=2993448 RepID=UPI0024A65FF8|nr:DUF2958 domain-containing protein [Pelagibius sp. Alg239-R121]